MEKKLKPDALMIKDLLSKGYRQCEISRLLKIKKENVSFWSKYELRTSQNKKKKLKDKYINAIQRWANNKVNSAMSSRTIANKINSLHVNKKEFNKNGKQLSVNFTTVNNYLKQYFRKPRKLGGSSI